MDAGATLTVTVSAASAEQVRDLILELARLFTSHQGVALDHEEVVNEDAAGSGPSPADWYREHGPELLARLRPAARLALTAIVEHGPVVPFGVVEEALASTGGAFPGSLVSIGAATRRAPARPYRADHRRRLYLIDPEIQAVLRAALASFSPGPTDGDTAGGASGGSGASGSGAGHAHRSRGPA